MRYTKLTIKGLRGIRDLEINDFRRVNLFVGANNCGKTTILESLFLLAGPTNPQLPLKINNFRNFYTTDENSWGVFFNELDTSSDIKLSSELDKPKEVRNLLIKTNMTMINSTDGYTGSMPVVSGLILEYSFAKGINKKFEKFVSDVTVKAGNAEFKIPKDHKETLRGVFVNSKTLFQDLDIRFNNIQIRKQTDRIVKILRQVEPALIDISLGTDGIVYCDVGLDRLVPINVMGDGMFRLLSIISAISDTQGGIVLIDEIENGFHYSSQELLWNAIFEASKEFNVQIFATTHSIECVKAFSSSYNQTGKNNDDVRLYRIERKDGDFRVVSYDHNVLEASLDSGWEVR